MGFLHRGRLYSLTTPSDLLRFSALSVGARLRLGAFGLYMRLLKDWRPLERVTAKEWIIRMCGEQVFHTVWKPLLAFKFGEGYENAPATYIWSRVKRQATTRKDRSKKEVLAYVRGGFKAIIDTLVREVTRLGGVIRSNTAVDRIETAGGRVRGVTVGGRFEPFDKAVATVPITQTLKLLDGSELGKALGSHPIIYQGVVCVLLALKQPLSRYYWIPVVDSGVSFSGIVETTALIHREDVGGNSLVYLVNYVPRDSAQFRAPDDEILTQSIGELQSLFPEFHPGHIAESRVSRAAFVEPLWTVDYSSRLPQRSLLDDSLFVLTTAQLYPEINSTSNCVKQVKSVLDRLTAESTPAPRRQEVAS
jgi:protoporphyrinogen oxidase